MEDYVKDALTASPYPFWITVVILVIIMGVIQFIISYFTTKGKYKAMIEEIRNLSYNKEKGKNIATKQDIGDITKEIKLIESTFINETEKLKANLLLLTGIQTNIASEERNAIIGYIQCLYNWDISTSDSSVDISNNNKLEKHLEEMENLYYKTVNSQTLFNLFIDDNILKNSAYDLMKNIITTQATRTKYIYELIKVNNEFYEAKEKQYQNTKEKREALDKILKKRASVYSEGLNNVSKAQSKYIGLKHEFEQKCRDRIYLILSKPEH